jgi:hypothetical protein
MTALSRSCFRRDGQIRSVATEELESNATESICIGFHKTGTKSLASALSTLGYRVTGPNGVKDPDIGKNVYAMTFSLVERFDPFQDNPWPIIYKELDKKYPESKFVLSVRTSDSWIKSRVDDFGTWETSNADVDIWCRLPQGQRIHLRPEVRNSQQGGARVFQAPAE